MMHCRRHFTHRLARGLAPVAMSLGITLGAGCSVVLDFPQCTEDIDCTNAEGIELVCRSNECVVPVAPSSVACDSNASCVAEFDDSVVCGASDTCASLDSEHCDVRIQPGDDPDNIVYIGSILPTSGTYRSMGVPLDNAVQLAVEDFNSAATLPGGQRVGWVSCDSAGDPAMAQSAAVELAAMGITAVVGPGLSEEMVSTVQAAAPRNMLLMSPTASAAVLGQLLDGGLVWRTAGNDAVQAAGIADRLAAFDPPLERVVVLAKGDQYGNGLLADLTPRLESLLPAGGLDTQVHSGLESFADTEALLSEYGARIAATFDHDPQVVVILGSIEARELVLFYLEAWAGADPRPSLPSFVLSSEAAPQVRPIVEGVSESFRDTLMSRLEAVGHLNQDADNYGPFQIRYEIRFPDEEAGLDAGLAYDAAMAMLLAMSALPQGGADGPAIAGAMARIADPSAPTVNFDEGLSFVQAAQQTLDSGGNVSLRGISGVLEIDLESGDTRRGLSGYDVEASSSGVPRLVERRRYELNDAPSVTGTWVDL